LRQAYDYWQNQPGNNPKPGHRNAQARPSRGRNVLGRGPRKQSQLLTTKAHKTPTQQAINSIAPTEFPKERSVTGCRGVTTDNNPATYGPQEEKTLAASHTQGADTRQSCPPESVYFWHSQQSTNSKRCLLKVQQGFGCTPRQQAQSQRRCFKI